MAVAKPTVTASGIDAGGRQPQVESRRSMDLARSAQAARLVDAATVPGPTSPGSERVKP